MSEVLLMSGGMDSVALAAWRRPAHAVTVDYGQLAAAGELRAARQACEVLGIAHHLVTVDCRSLGSGDMAGGPALAAAPVPEWWPYRNQLLVTLGAMKAITLGASALLVGSVKTDAVHVDGTAEFFATVDRLVGMQEGAIRVVAPAVDLTTAELVRAARVDRSLLGWCHSCHRAEYACGRCRGCNKYRSVMEELGYGDVALGLT
jgi:7-cyano-7-deazaguanine synthase